MRKYFSGSYSYLKEKLLGTVENLQKDPTKKISFVVHTNQMKRYLKEYLTENLGILINAEFYTVIDISKKIADTEPLSDFEKEIIIKRILQKNNHKLSGISSDISTLIQQLKEYEISVESLSSPFLKDIIIEYENFKKGRFSDREDLHLIASNCETDFQTDSLIIFGIHSVPPLYRRLFRRLSKLSENIFVFTFFLKDSGYYTYYDHFKDVRSFYEEISDFVEFETVDSPLLELSKRIYRFDVEVKIDTPYVRIFQASGERKQIEKVAQEIVKLRKKGIDYHKIGVVVPDLQSCVPFIKDTFNRYHIPYYLSEESRYLDDYHYRKVFSLIELKTKEISKETVLSVISDSVFDIENPDIIHSKIQKSLPFRDINELERFIFSDGEFKKFRELIFSIYSLPEEESIHFYTKKLKEISDRFIKNKEVKEFLEGVLDLIEGKKVYKELFERISYTDFVDILKSFFEEENKENRPAGSSVLILSPTSAEANNFEHIFFLNLNSNRFPDISKNELLISREKLGKFDYPYHIFMQELLNFASFFDKNKNLYLFFIKKSDISGKDEIPSIFLQEVIRITGKKIEIASSEVILPYEIKIKFPYIFEEIRTQKKRVENYRKSSIESFKTDIEIKKPIPATSFQKYSQCPYRFFMEDINGFSEEEEIDRKEISPIDRGILIHKILEEFYREVDIDKIDDTESFVENKKEELKEKYFSRINQLLDDLIPSYRPSELKKAEITFGRLISFLKEDLKILKERGHKIYLIEKEIQDKDFSGRVDRADIDKNGMVYIYDYKTGEKPPQNINKEIKRKYSQLLVYSRVLGKSVKEIGIFAVNDRTGKFRYTTENIDTGYVEELLHFLIRGYFPPVKSSMCDYCSFSDFCPRNEAIISEIKEKLLPFREIV
ncbi:ATP-dependent helicase/DNAse subunit B [Persephonella hydrogeniphila]|uniref:ATP-dependent helicase/DNAse subunit B n=1 Tax=Persephonella hydrogeniphila TaxID=198703 RepID=A0A285NIY0_9AQUI|nr:PD-(D/E)XK nuclease family protein [Persephonella hydrogeniphila]SNZ07816.1 ATP-dependent helicase/DNAse subunit B [Persephonella hydrogeniphila]